MNYLIYIEHAAENLQFFLWYRDYSKRFGEAKSSDIALAPEWTQAMEDDTAGKIKKDIFEKRKGEPEAAEIFRGTDFEKTGGALIENKDPFSTPPRTAGTGETPSILSGSHTGTYRSQAQVAFTDADVKQPCKLWLLKLAIGMLIT
jgi:hypothetical protein